jgi:hypothetical protein
MQPIAGVTACFQTCITAQKVIILPSCLTVFHLLLLLGVLQDALGFQASPCLLESPSLNAALQVSISAANNVATAQPRHSQDLPGVRLEPVANNAESNRAEEAVEEDVLPALLLRLLAGLDAEQPAGWRVVVVAVCVAAPARGRGGDLSLL